MAKGFIDRILDQIFDDEWTGRRGEKLTEHELKLVKLFGRDGKVLRNVYVPKGTGETSEIDVIFITQKGIFVIESKNYSGWIFGNEADKYWTASLLNGQKNRFYNPIMQNRGHIKWLRKYLADDTPLFSIIVFSERCELKKVTVSNDEVYVIKRDRLYATVRSLWDGVADVLDNASAESLYARLEPLTNADAATKAAHVADIKRNYIEEGKTLQQKPSLLQENPMDAPASLCPKCDGTLVLRTAKKGPGAGNQFYGCSNYPKCRFTRNA